MGSDETIECVECGQPNLLDRSTCYKCGAPLDDTDLLLETEDSEDLHPELSRPITCGVLLILAGIGLFVYYAFFFDTSIQVPASELIVEGGRVNNLGLAMDRLVGVVSGIGLVTVGCIINAACYVRAAL